MKKIVWRSGQYKYREALLGYIKNIRVAAITPRHDKSYYDAKFLLPGFSKGINSHHTLEGAKVYLEDRINEWFDRVE